MDTKTLIKDARARFSHNSAKAYLKEKYNSKLVIAEQGGLWRADSQTIALLQSLTISTGTNTNFKITTGSPGADAETAVLIDTFDNPVEVEIGSLLESLTTLYNTVMTEWNEEWKQLENKR